VVFDVSRRGGLVVGHGGGIVVVVVLSNGSGLLPFVIVLGLHVSSQNKIKTMAVYLVRTPSLPFPSLCREVVSSSACRRVVS